VTVGIYLLPVEPPALFRNGSSQTWLAPRHPVLIPASAHRLFCSGEHFLRWIEIRKALGQKNRSFLERIARNGANNGLLKFLKSPCCKGFLHALDSKSDLVQKQAAVGFFPCKLTTRGAKLAYPRG